MQLRSYFHLYHLLFTAILSHVYIRILYRYWYLTVDERLQGPTVRPQRTHASVDGTCVFYKRLPPRGRAAGAHCNYTKAVRRAHDSAFWDA